MVPHFDVPKRRHTHAAAPQPATTLPALPRIAPELDRDMVDLGCVCPAVSGESALGWCPRRRTRGSLPRHPASASRGVAEVHAED
jgi:GTP cyclohydrolase III